MALRSRFALFLAPSIVQALLAFFTLPLATLVLGPAEYGAFAVVTALTGLGGALATSASGMLVPAHYPRLDARERAALIRALLAIGTGICALFAAALAAAWGSLAPWLDGAQLVDAPSLALALAAMFCALPWSTAYLIIILEGQAGTYAKVIIAAALASTATLLAGLFWWNLGAHALFAAALASSAVQFGGSASVLAPYLQGTAGGGPSWARRVVRTTLASGVANSMELVQTSVERLMLARFAGTHGVGLYSHAQMYRSMAFAALKAASNSIWPRSLEEARAAGGEFADTRRVWVPIYVVLTVAGVAAAFLGGDFVALLTHGKFREAGTLIPALLIVLFLQFSGKPQLAVLYARDEGEYLGKLMGLCAALSVAALALLVPVLGVWGILAALAAQQLMFRAGVQWRARKHGPTPFLDRMVVQGVAMIALAMAIELALRPGAALGAALAAGMTVAVLVMERRASRALWSAVFRAGWYKAS